MFSFEDLETLITTTSTRFFLILRSFILGLQMGMGWHACYSHSSVMGAPLL